MARTLPGLLSSSSVLGGSLVTALVVGASVLLGACADERGPAESAARRFKVEVLAHGIDPKDIPDRFAADFDGDGEVDRVTLTAAAVRIELTGGSEFYHAVREPDQKTPGIDDAALVSLRPDGRFPSLVLASVPETGPEIQHVVYNDAGTLAYRRLGAYPVGRDGTLGWSYPMRPYGLDCAWLDSNDLPVCFFASEEDGALGVSRLIELDVNGYRRLASDPAVRSYYDWRMTRSWDRSRQSASDPDQMAEIVDVQDAVWRWTGVDSATLDRILAESEPGSVDSTGDTLIAALDWLQQASPRRQAQAYLRMDTGVFDSLLAESGIEDLTSAADYFAAVAMTRVGREAVFSRDVTREYRLPWPANYGHARPGAHGMFMMDAVFLDFTGDGLLDLVVVGQHSKPFSAIQHPNGYFTNAEFHAVPDEYLRVWAPRVGEETGLTAPPCVYYGMEEWEGEAWKSDYLDCFDQASNSWYEVSLPEGPYWTEYDPVMFWDMNDDGTIDFAARREDGSWTALTFVRE